VRNFVSLDTRSREVRHRDEAQKKQQAEKAKKEAGVFLVVRQYRSSVGMEYFIAYEDVEGYLYGFTRLLLPDDAQAVDYPGLGIGTAIIRELHVYGKVASISDKGGEKNSKQQHRGIGSRLMARAEETSQTQGYQKLSVIAGIGVKSYYRDVLGYENEGTYVVKRL
jgi:elongator complex protein 3